MPPISRRRLIQNLAAGPATIHTSRLFSATGSHFNHGVASGDPDSKSVILWTRITTEESAVQADWEIARDQRFRRIVASGAARTDTHRDYTLKVLATGL